MSDGYKRLTLQGSKDNINTAIAEIRSTAVADDDYFVKPNKVEPKRKILTPAEYDTEGNETTPATYSEDYFATIIVRDQEQLNAAIEVAEKKGVTVV